MHTWHYSAVRLEITDSNYYLVRRKTASAVQYCAIVGLNNRNNLVAYAALLPMFGSVTASSFLWSCGDVVEA